MGVKQLVWLVFWILGRSFVNATQFAVRCQTDSQCASALTSGYKCVDSVCSNTELTTIGLNWMVGCLLIFFISAIANSAGVGGAAILVPVFAYVFELSIGDSVAMAQIAILSGSVLNLTVIANKRRKDNKDVLLADFPLLSRMVPLVLAGSMVGIMLHKLLPEIVILFTLTAYLGYTMFKLYYQLKSQITKENDSIEVQIMELRKLEATKARKSYKEPFFSVANELFESELKETQKRSFWSVVWDQRWSVGVCFLTYLFIVVTNLLRGGRQFKSVIGISSCSVYAWIVFFGCQFACVYVERTVRKAVQLPNKLEMFSEDLVEQLTQKSYVVGVIAGCLGIGGGIAINPILLAMKIEPETASVLTAFVVFFSTISTSTQFMFIGAYSLANVVVVSVFSGGGSYFGSKMVQSLVQQYKRPSILVGMLMVLLGIAIVVLPLVGILDILEKPLSGFGLPC